MSATIITVVSTVLINVASGGHGPRLLIFFVLGVMFLCFRIAQANQYRIMPRVIVLSCVVGIGMLPIGLVALGAVLHAARRHHSPSAAASRPGAYGPQLPPPQTPPAAGGLPGLIGYWSFDDGVGRWAADGSGGRNHAALEGTGWTEGVRGRALQLQSKEAYCSYGASARFNFAAQSPFTIAGWVKTKESSGTVVSQRNHQDPAPVIDITVEGSSLRALVRHDREQLAPHAEVTSKYTIDDDQWHHFALVRYPGDTIEWFVDGASHGKASARGAGGPITTDLRAVGSERLWVQQQRGKVAGATPYL